MPANFPGATNALPGPYTNIQTLSRGVAVPIGSRIAALVGEGRRVERLVNSANGSGNDGLNPTYSSSNGSTGRHFQLALAPIITNRTTVFKNGIPLTGLEQAFDEDSGSFVSLYDYRINITTGHIELQTAHLVDQGGEFYSAPSTNVGNGVPSSLALSDLNAPSETWTIRVSSVRKDGYGDPIDGYAKFIASGSVSGILLDGYGNQVTWQSDGVVVTNGVLSFAINEGVTAFNEGDRFTVEVKSGALVQGDSLIVHYIHTLDINDCDFFQDLDDVFSRFGSASLSNRLSLGAQLAFANGPPGIYCCQAAPSIPRRVSYLLEASASGGTAVDDLNFALPLGVVPDFDTNINFFVTDSSGVESQLIPNKVGFYDATITASPTLFHFGPGWDFSYTVIIEDSVQKEGDDGVITSVTGTTATLSSVTVGFTSDDDSATRSVQILAPAANAGTFPVVSVSAGVVTISDPGGFVTESAAEFRVIDSTDTSTKILFTDDLALAAGESIRAAIVDTKDADFFDANWINAYQELEKIEVDMVVPIPSQTISSIFQQGRVHVETMSNIKNRKERILLIGAIRGLDPEHVIGTEPAAVEDIGVLEGIQGDDPSEILSGNIEDLVDYGIPNSFGQTFRVVYLYPDEIVVQIGADRTLVDGFFIASAAAGYFSGVPDVAVPLTNKTLSGFTILRDKLFRPIILENLAVSGVCTLQPAIGGGNVIWGKTTTQSLEPTEEEISIVFIRDKIAKGIRKVFAPFVGNPESDSTQGSLMARAQKAMQSFVSQGLITKFSDVKVARDSVEPRQWNVSAIAQPRYPINWVYIRIEVGTIL